MSSKLHDLVEFEVDYTLTSSFKSVCFFDWSHKIKRGDRIFKPRSLYNPFVPAQGYGCPKCHKLIGY